MASDRPRIRGDLIISRQELRDGPSFVVKDPASDQFFRLRDVEHFVLTQLDGKNSPDAIRRKVLERFGAPLDPETLAEFVRALRNRGLLESTTPARSRSNHRRGDLLYLRFKAFDPDPLLEVLERHTRFVFTPGFLWVSAMIVLVGVLVAISSGPEFLREILALEPVTAIALAWLVFLVVGMAHELAHGLTCKHFGGRVSEIGFMLLYLQPALYCNVSDAWLFPQKSRRLWVTLAGSYCELVLWALAVLAWSVTDYGTPLHQVSLIVAAASGIKTLLNFNPLLKLDGYYLLSDLLEMPNLRRRSFQYVGARIRSWFGTADPMLGEATKRERRVYAWYGTLAAVFSVAILVLLTARLGGSLLGRYQALGLLPLMFVLGLALRRRLGRFMPSRGTSRSGASTPATAAPGAVARPVAPPARIRFRLPLAAAATILIGIALFLMPVELKVTGEFNVVPINSADVRATVDGFVSEVLVEEGDRVHYGSPIARLDDRELRAELVKVLSQEDQQAAVQRYADSNHRRFRALLDAQVVSRREYEAAEQQLFVSQADQQRLAAERRYLEDQLGRVEILSPIGGVVTTPSRELKALRNKLIRKGELVAQVHDLSHVIAEISVSEKEIADVVRNQAVVLKARAFPTRLFSGRVTSVGTRVQDGTERGETSILAGVGAESPTTSSKEVLVTTLLENPSLLLKPHMTGKAKILCGRQSAGQLLLRRLARTVRVELWSWW